MADAEQDIEVLATNLHQLLSGELKVGLGLMTVGKALGRQRANPAWIRAGLQKWLEENDEAVPLLAATLGSAGIDKLRAWLEKNPSAS